MKTSLCALLELEKRFPNLQPLESPDKAVSADLRFVGYWAAYQEGTYFLIIGYRPSSRLIERLDDAARRALSQPLDSTVEVEEYDDRQEWRERVVQLITPPGGGDLAGVGARLKPTPPARGFPNAEPLPGSA